MTSAYTRVSLLSRVRDPGDQAAWHEFETRYGDLIVRYARVRGLQVADAEDVRQHVLLDLYRGLRNFAYDPARGRFRDYLGRIVKNVVNDLRSRPKPSPRPEGMDGSSIDPAAGAAERDEQDTLWEQEWVDHHYRRAMRSVQADFEPRSVDVFERLLAGASVAELSTEYGLSEPAVHKIKQRIRDRLKELIEAQIREEDEPDAPAIRETS